MPTIAEWYVRVNSLWPADILPPTDKEAILAVRRLFRFVMKRTWRGKFALAKKHNGYTWPRGLVFYVNPNRRNIYNSNKGGWHDLIHDLSHYLHTRVHSSSKPHDRRHARLELKLKKEVLKRGWLRRREQPALPTPQG